MPLTRQDALRLLHFCLGPDDSGSVALADDGAALVTVARTELRGGVSVVRSFEATTFDAALRQAADAGILKAACVEKQIAFLSKEGARGTRRTPLRPPPRDLFPRLVSSVAPLIHEMQVERGMSSLCAASSGRHFRRELARQRERVDGLHRRMSMLRRELVDGMGASLAGRFDRVEDRLRALGEARASLDAGRLTAEQVITTYSDANAALLGIGDGALVAFATEAQHATALACVVLLYAKEKTGVERAHLGAAFAARSFSDVDRQALSALRSARRSYLHVFSTIAPRAAEAMLAQALGSTGEADLARAEALILAGREDETDLDARGWFTLTSRQIELLAEIATATIALVTSSSSG